MKKYNGLHLFTLKLPQFFWFINKINFKSSFLCFPFFSKHLILHYIYNDASLHQSSILYLSIFKKLCGTIDKFTLHTTTQY